MKLTGTVKAFSAAFGVSLAKVKHGAATYRMRTGSVNIPADLKDIVVGVHGLDNRPVARPRFRVSKQIARHRAKTRGTAGSAAGGSFAVTNIAKLYNFPTAQDGAGQSSPSSNSTTSMAEAAPTAPL